ncbi:hypothetical protein DPMN_087453 [Dreissena polymorpha]|uniref:Uncharacterized protein n=1 Tax=Dreissena polymorpha TaxID=45954 RepID=A0A9D4KT63_DREPO|nr:hypothetical protein DPMN_087453 [Dreissena polymorpha]
MPSKQKQNTNNKQSSTKKKKGKKRNLSTPDGGAEQPGKRVVAHEPSPSASSMSSTAQCHQNFQSVNPMQSPNQVSYNMSNMAALNAYQTSSGAFYSPQPQQVQYHQMQPMHQSAQQTVLQGQGTTQTFNDNLSQILDRLNSVDARLSKLDTIQSQLSELNKKMSSIVARVISLETASKEMHTRMSNIEDHREFDSKQCEDIKSKQCFLESELKAERDRIRKLESEIQKSNSVQEEINDLKSRSMRNNLMFLAFLNALHQNRDAQKIVQNHSTTS